MATYINRSGSVFAAQVGRWTIRMKDRTKRVWQESMIMLVYRMQLPVGRGGNMPVDTGFLRSSLMWGTAPIQENAMPRPSHGAFLWFPNQFETFIESLNVGVKVYLGYIAEYAGAVEYGHHGIPGRGFKRLAVQMWPSIVLETEARLRSAR